MNFFPTVWNVLHDGNIVNVTGQVPGALRVDVEIPYLRTRIPDPGKTIVIALEGCSRFAYRNWDSEFITDLRAIVELKPAIVSAEMQGDLCCVYCVDGLFEVAVSSGTISLDSGRTLPLDELIATADAYWEAWKKMWAERRL